MTGSASKQRDLTIGERSLECGEIVELDHARVRREVGDPGRSVRAA